MSDLISYFECNNTLPHAVIGQSDGLVGVKEMLRAYCGWCIEYNQSCSPVYTQLSTKYSIFGEMLHVFMFLEVTLISICCVFFPHGNNTNLFVVLMLTIY